MEHEVIGTGLTGLVGTRITALLSRRYKFENISLETGVDIRNHEAVVEKISHSKAPIVLHLAAKADVDGCELDKEKGMQGDAWQINVVGTQNVIAACQKANKKLLYISTDFVFDGTKEFYTEEDIPNPVNWYAQTKYEGEKLVTASSIQWIIVRLAYPYRASFPIRSDFLRSIKKMLEEGKHVKAVTDHIMTPTFIDDMAIALDMLIRQNALGIYHIVGGSYHSPYEAALSIAKTFGYNTNLIAQTTREQYFSGRAPRPLALRMKHAKIAKLGVTMKSFEDGLQEVKRQMTNY